MKKITKKLSLTIVFIVLLAITTFLIYALNYYKADETANTILTNENVIKEKNLITLYPETDSNTGIIFYPGAKVEYTSYLPLLNKLTERGYICFLPKMPLNFAFFDYDVADDIIANNPNIENWYIGGHSLGGAMSSYYASKNLDKIDGVILLGAYVYGDIPLDETIVLYGSEDLILNKEKLKNTDNEIEIKGGNHSMFGNYRHQKNDGKGTITREEQQEITVNFINEFITKNLKS